MQTSSVAPACMYVILGLPLANGEAIVGLNRVEMAIL